MFRLPWTAKTAPNFALEVNQQCNITCAGCYKKRTGSSKSLSEITKDLDIVLSARKIHTVSIVGAEPTLHPQLCDIIELLHKRNLKTALLTNGLTLDDSYLSRLRNAGLNVVMFHIDEGQDRPDLPTNPSRQAVTELRTRLTKRAAAHGLDVGLTVTIYRNNIDRVVDLVRYILNSEHIHFLFATNYVDILGSAANECSSQKQPLDKKDRTTNREVMQLLKNELDIEPFAYLSGYNKSEETLYWMSYFVPVMNGPLSEIVRLRSGFVDLCLTIIPKLLTGRYIYYCKPNRLIIAIQTSVNLLVQGKIRQFKDFTQSLFSNTEIRAKRMVFDNGPLKTEDGRVMVCEFCPGATIKNGALVPVCVSDCGETP